MRVGLSWDLDREGNAGEAWKAILAEIERADQLGYDSVWVPEGRDANSSCPQPSMFLTSAAPKTTCIQLVAAARRVGHASPTRIAEEVAVLDLYSRGRAGIAFAPGDRQGVSARHVHEMIEFVNSAWTADEFRYRGEFIRFPSHTADDAPEGSSEPGPERAVDFVPQWEAGPVQPDFLTITPKPYQRRPPVYVEIDEDETLEWAARNGISPMLRAEVATDEAIERLARYRKTAGQAGHGRAEVDAVLERRIDIDGKADTHNLAGAPMELVKKIRELKASGSFAHLVWRRDPGDEAELVRFASQVQPLLQA